MCHDSSNCRASAQHHAHICMANLQDQSDQGAAEVQQLQTDLAAAVEAEAEKDKEVQALGILLAYPTWLKAQYLFLLWCAALVVFLVSMSQVKQTLLQFVHEALPINYSCV